jgi:hypothetical protein
MEYSLYTLNKKTNLKNLTSTAQQVAEQPKQSKH